MASNNSDDLQKYAKKGKNDISTEKNRKLYNNT
jgi:hypothetical protein